MEHLNQSEPNGQSEHYASRLVEERLFGVRINTPNGQITADQLETIGWLSQMQAHSTGEVTRRQAIRLQGIRIGDLQHILRELANVGLTTQKAQGNARRTVEIFRDHTGRDHTGRDRSGQAQSKLLSNARSQVRTGRQTDGLHYVGTATLRGRFSGGQMVQVAGLARFYGKSRIRLTPAQTLLILDVPAHNVEAVNAELQAVGLKTGASPSHLHKMEVTA